MQKFHEKLLQQSAQAWEKILSHPFLIQTAERKIPDTTFKTWMRQDYIFVREAIPFVAVLLAKCPVHLRSTLVQVLAGLDQELGLFRKNAQAHGVNLENIEPAPTCHAYIQFLMTTAHNCSFEEAFTVLYVAEKLYLDSWMVVKKNLKGTSPWQEFIDNWTSPAFAQYVDWLATTLDELVRGKPDSDLDKCAALCQMAARYEYLFWEMAISQEKWVI